MFSQIESKYGENVGRMSPKRKYEAIVELRKDLDGRFRILMLTILIPMITVAGIALYLSQTK